MYFGAIYKGKIIRVFVGANNPSTQTHGTNKILSSTMTIDKKQVMPNSCNASNEKKTAVIDTKGYCVVSTLLHKSIFLKRVFTQSLRLFCVRKFRSKSLEAAIISAFMTCSNIATHRDLIPFYLCQCGIIHQ